MDYYDGNKESLDLQTQRIKLPRAVAVDKWGLASGSCPVASAAAASSQDAMEVAQFYTAGACSSPQLTPALRPRLAERLVDTLLMWRVDQTAPSARRKRSESDIPAQAWLASLNPSCQSRRLRCYERVLR